MACYPSSTMLLVDPRSWIARGVLARISCCRFLVSLCINGHPFSVESSLLVIVHGLQRLIGSTARRSHAEPGGGLVLVAATTGARCGVIVCGK